MKVLYFHQHFSTPQGATSIRSYEMAKRLVARGHSVTMVCGSYAGGNTGLTQAFSRGRRRGRVEGIEVLEFDLAYSNATGFVRRSIVFARFALRCVGLVFSENYDLVFATTTPLTAGIPGIFARWLRGKPFIFEVRDLWPELPKAMGVVRNPLVLAAMAGLEWLSYRSAHRLIGLAPGIVDGIARRGVPRQRIAMISNGCDIDIFSSAASRWRPDGVRDTDLLAAYTGTLGLANGLDAVLDAAAELKARGRDDIKLLLVGQGRTKAALMARAARENLDNVIFHDAVDKQRLAGLLQATDIGMQILADVPAFYFGTSPNKFFDYIAAGLPVLSNYPGWVASLIEQNACGFAITPRDPKAFADVLEAAAADPAMLAVMGARARTLAAAEFDRAALSKRFAEWLEGAANRR
jgi:glycosyltransferase involved in cell wall biosynthesis